jgi:hypothetical protein
MADVQGGVPEWYLQGYRNEDEWRLNNGMPTSTGQVDPGLVNNAQGLNGDNTPMYPNLGPDTQPQGDGTAQTPNMVTFKGIQYDLNNQADRNAFIQIQSAEVDKKLSDALKSGQLGYAAKLLDYKHSWEAQGQTLQEGYNQGQTARQQNYQGLGTRAYQSAMGASGQYALNKLGEAQNERNYQKNQYNSGLEQAYNDWIGGAQENAQGQKDTLSTNVANIGDFNPTSVSNAQTDLSAYTPAVNFQQFANQPSVNQGKFVSQAPVQQQTLADYLQQVDPSKQSDTLNQYLLGKTA